MRMIWKLTLLFFAAAVSLQAVDFGRTNTGNLALNGSFEAPPISAGSESATFVPGWTAGSGTPVVQRSFNGVTAYDGDQNVALGSNNSSLFQDLATTPGQEYQIRFAYASSNQSSSSVSVSWGGSTLGTVTTTSTTFQVNTFTTTATSSTTRLQFNRSSGTILLDAVAVIPSYGIVLSQFADGGGWRTTILFANPTDRDVLVQTLVYGEDGQELDPALRFSRTMRAKETATFVSPGTAQDVRVGWVSVSAGGDVSLTGIFTYRVPNQPDFDAAVPARVPTYSLLAPYDNTNGFVTGVALVNPRNQRVNLVFTFRDENGVPLLTRTIVLNPQGHLNYVLREQFPAVADTKGSVEVTGRADDGTPSEFTAVGILGNPTGAFTTLPY